MNAAEPLAVSKLYCAVSMFGIGRRKRNSNRPPSTIHSGNLPAPVFRLVVPRCRIGSRSPTTSLPWAFTYGGFPSTSNFDRPPSGKRQRRMIYAVKDGAWLIKSSRSSVSVSEERARHWGVTTRVRSASRGSSGTFDGTAFYSAELSSKRA
jgi:hypothetical protein